MEEREIDLRDYINMVRKRWKIILIIFLAPTVTAGVLSFLSPKTYESSAIVSIGKVKDKLLEEPATVIEVFKTKPVLKEVAEELNISPTDGNLGELSSKIKMREKSKLLEIKGRVETQEEALNLVNGVIAVLLKRHEQLFKRAKLNLDEYLASGQERLAEMEKEIKSLEKKIEKLGTTISEARALIAQGYMESLERTRDRYEQLQLELRMKKMEESSGMEGTQLVIPAVIPEKPVGPKKKQNVLIAGILGLFIGFISAAVVEYFEKPSAIS